MLTHDAAWRAVWYRHWLEHAGGACVAVGCVTLMCIVYAVASGTGADPLRTHVVIVAVAAWVLSLFLHGTGIRTNDLQPGHQSLYYTMTLPVPRTRLVWTRFVVACVSATLLQMLMLGLNAVTLTALGHSVPLGAMVAASALATLLLLIAVAAIGLMNAWNDSLGYTASPIVLGGIAFAAWQPMTELLGSAAVPWTVVGVMGLLIAAPLALTAVVARTRDF